MTTEQSQTVPTETDDLLNVLAERRSFLLHTSQGLSDEQARLTPTASELCIGGLIKHVSAMESQWMDFVLGGAAAMPQAEWESYAEGGEPPAGVIEDFHAQFRLLPEESLAQIVEEYGRVAEKTERTIRGLDSLDVSHELPKAPWFEPGAHYSARRVVMHLIGETAQHAGHADIIRETIDGQKSMG